MKKNNPRKYLFNAMLIFIGTGIGLSILLQDTFLDLIITNTLIWHYINQAKPFIIFITLGIIFFSTLNKALRKQLFLSKAMEESRQNQVHVLEHIKKEFFFFRHTREKEFEHISVGIYEMFGYQREDFKINFRKYGFGFLYDNIFETLAKHIENIAKLPEFEYETYTSEGKKKYISVSYNYTIDNKGDLSIIEGVVRDISSIKASEQGKKEKVDMYRTLFEANNEAIVILKADKFIDCNAKISKMFEASFEEVIMHTPYSYKFSPPFQPDGRNSREKALEKIRLALSGFPQTFLWQHLKSNTQPFMVEVTLSRFTEGDENYLFGILIEMDAETKTKNELIAQKDNLRNIIFNNPFPIALFNKNGKVNNCNEAFKKLFGELNDKEITEIIQNDDFLACYVHCCNGETQSFSGEVHLTEKDEKICVYTSFIPLFNELKQADGGLVILEELSELHELKKRFSECEKGFVEILSNAREVLYKLICSSGRYEYISPSLTNVLGYTPDEFYQMNAEEIKDLLHPEDTEKSNLIIAKLIVPIPGQDVNRIIDYRIRHKDGHYCWLSDKYSVHFDQNGVPLHISGNVVDITQLKEAEETLRKYNKLAN
ncbi:MAG: hypothetical protein CVU05_08705 [Bacteroidetes bacterium HGW-Bacteroidetes-21]|jgi:PAS domain S-box-containing protein|nr:MAG: hypothetical protein CVU05_08705 [Bacteroidetes bacterium HGW-Bacteroidetes-21]